MTYSHSMESSGGQRQADLERIVRRALRANRERSVLARRVEREAEELAARGIERTSPQAIREIARRLSRDLDTAQTRRDPQPFPGTVVSGTIVAT